MQPGLICVAGQRKMNIIIAVTLYETVLYVCPLLYLRKKIWNISKYFNKHFASFTSVGFIHTLDRWYNVSTKYEYNIKIRYNKALDSSLIGTQRSSG